MEILALLVRMVATSERAIAEVLRRFAPVERAVIESRIASDLPWSTLTGVNAVCIDAS